MSLTRVIKEPSFTGIAAGSIASARVYTRGNICNLYLRALTGAGAELTRAQILADIGDIVVKVNGIIVVQADADFLLDRQKYMGDSLGNGNVDGIIPIPFELAYLPTPQGRRVASLGTADVNTISVEATIDGVAQLATLELFTEVDNEPIREVGNHIRITKFTRNFGATGANEVSDLPYSDQNVLGYLAAHIKFSSGALDTVEVKRNGLVIVDNVPMSLNQVLNAQAFRTDQSGYEHIDFGRARSLDSLLPMANTSSLLWTFNWITAAPNNYNIYTERVFKSLR